MKILKIASHIILKCEKYCTVVYACLYLCVMDIVI